MAYYAGATKFLKASIFFIIAAMILSIIAIATSYWIIYDGGNAGIWEICRPTAALDYCVSYGKLQHDYNYDMFTSVAAVLALHAVGLFSLFLALIFIAAYFCLDAFESNDRLIQLTLVFVVVACLLINIASIIFGANAGELVPTDLSDGSFSFSWSFVVGAVAGVFAIIAALLLLCDQCCYRNVWNNAEEEGAFVDSKHSHKKRGTWAQRSTRGQNDPWRRAMAARDDDPWRRAMAARDRPQAVDQKADPWRRAIAAKDAEPWHGAISAKDQGADPWRTSMAVSKFKGGVKQPSPY